ncbi:MAG: hypothetical protein ACHQ52_02405 [Candidatus Eisenbacteria bacterium]
MKWSRIVTCTVLVLAVTTAATRLARAERVYMEGGYFVGAFPTGDWSKVAGAGLGLDGTTIARLGPTQPLCLRSSFGWAYNFSRTVDVPSAQLGPGDQLAIQTSNNSIWLGVGPELSKPTGDARGFVFATVGFNTNWTNGGLDGTVGGLRYSANVGATSTIFAWSAGGGLRKMMKGTPGGKVELSAEYRSGTGHNYLMPGDVASSGTSVAWDRKGHSSDQILIRLGSVFGQ